MGALGNSGDGDAHADPSSPSPSVIHQHQATVALRIFELAFSGYSAFLSAFIYTHRIRCYCEEGKSKKLT